MAAAAALLGFMSASATAGSGDGRQRRHCLTRGHRLQSDPAGGPLSGPQVALWAAQEMDCSSDMRRR
jgi:hypothetical protein